MRGSEYPSLNPSVGGRREDVLVSGIKSMVCAFGSSSSPDSSSEEGVDDRRAGGSLSPNAIVLVGGGGSLFEPKTFRSLVEISTTVGGDI